MKLALLSSVLLLVPLVFAQSPSAKIIYSDGFVLAEFANIDETPIFTYRRGGSALEFFLFGSAWSAPMAMSVTIDNSKVDSSRDERVSFVVEAVEQSGEEIALINNAFCKSNSSSELRHRIQRCTGEMVLREIRPDEISQMEALKDDVRKRETGQQVYVFHEKGLLLTQTVHLKRFEVEPFGDRLKIAAFSDPAFVPPMMLWEHMYHVGRMPRIVPGHGALVMQLELSNFEDMRFAVEAPIQGETNCYRPPVPGLASGGCEGNLEITDGSDDRKRALGKKAPRSPALGNRDLSLDDMSPEDLKKLLNDILGRL